MVQTASTDSRSVTRVGATDDQLAALQKAFLLDQLAADGVGRVSAGELNKKIGSAARRELKLTASVANRVRRELAANGYLELRKDGRTVSISVTDAGRAYLAGLERPSLRWRADQPAPVEEAAVPDELRDAQRVFLLL